MIAMSLASPKNFVNEQLSDIDLAMTRLSTQRLRDYINSDVITSQECIQYTIESLRRLEDEVETKYMICLAPHEASLFDSPLVNYDELALNAFPSSMEDVSEAGKCLAVGRYTASVFHLMRAMESILKVLGQKLNITVIDKNNTDLEWGKILSNLSAPIAAMQKGKEKDDWSAAQSLLVHVKQAWRNPTMHPKRTYTEEQANEIFTATRSFMNSLSALV
jgi:hypothetical protein